MPVQTVAIIGAGPAGLAAAKYLLAEKFFKKIVIFEQRNSVGGIWTYTPEAVHDDNFSVPQTDPRGHLESPIWRNLQQDSLQNGAPKKTKEAVFQSPIYDRLETNIPRTLMRFSDLPFPDDVQLFPKHGTVREYLEKYAEDVKHLIQFQTQITNVTPLPSQSGEDKWQVDTLDLLSEKTGSEIFDSVIVASGHFNVPYIPDIEGIKAWHEAYPESITHSKYYRTPDEYAGKKVVVVGNSASGLDIGAQIATVSQTPILQSQKSESYFGQVPTKAKIELPPISLLDPSKRTVKFENGHVETDVDRIVFCTGYFYSLPFLHKDLQSQLIEDGTRVCNTYQHLFYAPKPTLSFLILQQKIIPFAVAEVQAAVLARVYSGRLPLPTLSKMRSWEKENIAQRGAGGNFHTLAFPEDANYINEMHDWVLSAVKRDGLDNYDQGKIPQRWGPWQFWCRERFQAIRRAFTERGDARSEVRTIEELGFVFER